MTPTISDLRAALNVREVQLEPDSDPEPLGNGRWRVRVVSRVAREPLGFATVKRAGKGWVAEKRAPEVHGAGEVGDGDVFAAGAK